MVDRRIVPGLKPKTVVIYVDPGLVSNAAGSDRDAKSARKFVSARTGRFLKRRSSPAVEVLGGFDVPAYTDAKVLRRTRGGGRVGTNLHPATVDGRALPRA